MAVLTQKKTQYISAVAAASTQLLQLAVMADELAAFRTDNAFQTGGASAIVDADCIDGNNHLTAAQVEAVMVVVSAFSGAMTPARRTTLRQANKQPNS